MSPSSGADLPADGMTDNQALEIFRRYKTKVQYGQKLTADEKATLDGARDYIRTKKHGL